MEQRVVPLPFTSCAMSPGMTSQARSISCQTTLRKILSTKNCSLFRSFSKADETEVRVGVYDLEVFRAIDQARARLQKADRDLETLRKELSYKEAQAKLGR